MAQRNPRLNRLGGSGGGADWCAENAAVITPADADLAVSTRGLLLSAAASVRVLMARDETDASDSGTANSVLLPLAGGVIHPVSVRRVLSVTGGATVVGLW